MSGLQKFLSNKNVMAFLMVIRTGEGTADENGYRRKFGGELFDSFGDHPRTVVSKMLGGKPLSSSAAGAYQFLTRTWDGLVGKYAFPDFSPLVQDEAAVALISGRNALMNVVRGEFEVAIAKCAKEWASLPGSPYGQPTMTMAKARAVYEDFGGEYATASTAPPPKEKVMAPFLLAAIPSLISAIPEFAKIFSKPDVAERNTEAIVKASELIMEATEAPNIQAAVEKIQADPQAADAANVALRVNRAELVDMLERVNAMEQGNIATARDFSRSESPVLGKFKFVHLLSALVVIGAMIAIGYILATSTDATERAMALQAILLVGFAGVMAFWMGSSNGSQLKDERRLPER
ncbi:glycoside hydrolase family 104 protein [Malikia spinosa]|uniref:glycoside hydrolase family 24 protein n=1 Tax=Malikia spinosa TaxID=86180 RepID=UPI002FDA2F26